MLVIDTSGSMGASGMATVRRRSRSSSTTCRRRQGRCGVLRLDLRGRRRADDGPREGQPGGAACGSKGETALYAGVQDAVAALGTEGERSIVLLSDGGDTVAENKGGKAGEASQRKAALTR